MAKKKAQSDTRRFARYQSVVNILTSKHSFSKSEIYDALKDEKKAFIGRVIGELVRDGYLTATRSNTNSHFRWVFKKEPFNPGRWIDKRVFTATIKRSPHDERPRERLLLLGTSQLRTSELLAILIRAGIQGESAVQAGEKLAAHFGNDLEKLSLQARGELKQITPAVGKTAYCQIMAALELGKRLATQQQFDSATRPKIKNTADALNYCKNHFVRLTREATQEEFHVVLLDDKHFVIKSERVTVGLINQSLAHPREVFKPAIKESASALILVHNHPNGDPTPSQDDCSITKELKKAAETLGLRIIDHIILARDRILSMVDEKLF